MAYGVKNLSLDIDSTSSKLKELLSKNKINEALHISQNIVEACPNSPVALINHAMVNLAALRLEDAIDFATKANQYDKLSIRPYIVIARAFLLAEDFREALKYATRAHEIDPGSGEPQLLIGIALSRLKVHLDSEFWLSKAISSEALTPLQFAEAKFYISQEFLALGYEEELVLEAAREAIKIDPNNAIYLMGLGNILASFGRLNDAQKAFDKALHHSPLMGSLYWNKSRCLKFSESDANFIVRMQDLYVNAVMSDTDRTLLGFSLAKAYRDLGAYDQAFDCWETANAVQKRLHSFDIRAEQLRFVTYYRDFPVSKGAILSKTGVDEPTPIFILGMPRSGTTLAEQIIGSHSRVTPLGELEYLARAVGSAQQKFSNLKEREALLQIRSSYFKEIRRHYVKTQMFTDKMPLNFRFLPIIAHAFPEAKIVHCNRDPMAVCFSNFSNYFPAEGMVFSCSQTDIVSYYKLYEKYMEVMSAIFSERIYELDYSALTENQVAQTSRLLAGCTLEFESSCLEFNKSKRAIATASQRQVRHGMYKGSTEEWKKFSPWLTPMIEAFKA